MTVTERKAQAPSETAPSAGTTQGAKAPKKAQKP